MDPQNRNLCIYTVLRTRDSFRIATSEHSHNLHSNT